MTQPSPSSQASMRPALGAFLLICAMLLFPISDGIGKQLTLTYSVAFIIWLRFTISTVIVVPYTLFKKEPLRNIQIPMQVVRSIFMLSAFSSYLKALSLIPMTDALGAFFVAPVFAVILSSIFLKEPLNRRKVIAVVVGLSGAMIVVRPGLSMEVGMLYALAGGFFYACFLVSTRKVAQNNSPTTMLAFQSLTGAIITTPFAFMEWTVLSQEGMVLIVLGTLASLGSHFLTINAFRFALATTLSPLMYFELLGATIVGYLAFGDLPTIETVLGIVVIVAGGLILVDRSRSKKITKIFF